VLDLCQWQAREKTRKALSFFPARVIMQDFTGVPVIVDLAAMRSAMSELGGDPRKVNPRVPVDLVIDHSVQVDYFGTPDAILRNAEMEFERNRERYEFLHWAQKAFQNLRIVPPATGIVHQVNLEYLARVVMTGEEDGTATAFPDTLVGTDSHTTMINGLGVVGWGVGGIEAVAAMLGQPLEILAPDVVGFRLQGRLPDRATPTDLTLTITQLLRKHKVVDKFVEFFGPGLADLPLADRAMIANMSPENGATITYFPVDEQTLSYLRQTGRSEDLIEMVKAYCVEQQLFWTVNTPDPEYTETLELDLGSIEPSLAGPKRPQDRVALGAVQKSFRQALITPKSAGGYELGKDELDKTAVVRTNGSQTQMGHGAVAIAAITSCTNTSNPYVMVGAGLLARKAVERGLTVKPYVKTSLAPGSKVVTEYLREAGLLEPLEQLGFSLVGYGCTTCIGNSGPLPEPVAEAIASTNLVASSVLSGNRNFEGRINPQTLANYLASPMLVVAYALAGTVDIDLTKDPIGLDSQGKPVTLSEIWPSTQEVFETIARSIKTEMFHASYAGVYTANEVWNNIQSPESEVYTWRPESSYIQEPPYLKGLQRGVSVVEDIHGARVLAVLGDSITTDHISPAGTIPATSPAGLYLIDRGVTPREFNSYGARRGNYGVLTRGTFANIRLKNQLVPGVEGGFTTHLPSGDQMTIFEASRRYMAENVPLIVLAGKEYGTGSSRDWAAKGPLLLGVKAVIAESFERIHRSNLVGMGVLPLEFTAGQNVHSLGLTGRETFEIEGIEQNLIPGSILTVRARQEDGTTVEFQARVRINTGIEVDYYRYGGILQTVLYELAAEEEKQA
jgi:aconitate hydratase